MRSVSPWAVMTDGSVALRCWSLNLRFVSTAVHEPPVVQIKSVMSRKSVVIIGGGFAGLAAARELSGKFNVTIVDSKSYFDYTPWFSHAIVEFDSAAKCVVEYPRARWGNVLHKQGLVCSIQTDGARGIATLQSGETLSFDYAVVATGSTYTSGIKPRAGAVHNRTARLQELAHVSSQLEQAGSVVVVGGGAVGVEIAAAVISKYPNKKVSLVSSGGILQQMAPKAGAYALTWLKKHGVQVIDDERISDWGGLGDDAPGPAMLKAHSGKVVQADLVFKCVGFMPATSAFAASLTAVQLSPSGALQVDSNLQVVGWTNIFAAGDCTTADMQKTAATAGLSGLAAAGNIMALDAGKELISFPEGWFGGCGAPYIGGTALGSKEGVFQLGTDIQTGAVPAWTKVLLTHIYTRLVANSYLYQVLYRQLQRVLVRNCTVQARALKTTAT